jgi:hypothetical protein
MQRKFDPDGGIAAILHGKSIAEVTARRCNGKDGKIAVHQAAVQDDKQRQKWPILL